MLTAGRFKSGVGGSTRFVEGEKSTKLRRRFAKIQRYIEKTAIATLLQID
jgi:hypothetical protein